jgi:nucleoid DNA-binding protein
MSSPSAEEVIDAFIDVVREQLEQGESVEVPSLGTFAVEHRPSELTEEDGTRRLVPPRNVVVFEPEQE